MKDRIRSHIRDLSLGCHANHALQSDFSSLGLNHFEAEVLVRGILPSKLDMVESDCISSFLTAGTALYNLTIDGQGTGRNPRGYSNSQPVSDRLARQRAEAEQRRIDALFAEKRKHVLDGFETRLSALLPRTTFWAYFTATFVAALVIIAILIPNIKDGSLFILATVLAFVTSSFIRGHFQEKAKKTAEYQDLVRQRDEKLAALESERRNQNL
jgi:hypothetical protein